jgi:hypothetical protein
LFSTTNTILNVASNTYITWGDTGTNSWRAGPIAVTSFVIQTYDGGNWTNAVQFNRP